MSETNENGKSESDTPWAFYFFALVLALGVLEFLFSFIQSALS